MAGIIRTGFQLGGLAKISSAQSRSISPENFTGEKGRGGMATEGSGALFARDLGRGWKISPAVNVEPGKVFTLADIDGPGMIQSMWFGGFVHRHYILRIYWDSQETPSVECPLGDFFAYGWGESDLEEPCNGPFYQLNSLPVVVNPNKGLNCFWEMPFHQHCRMTIENRSESNYLLFYQINYSLGELEADLGYFHAQFRRVNPQPAMETYSIIDGIRGRGQYVGTAMFYGLNGAGNWWGEGELKFFIDGDKEYPTICGTGTEDYFGGSFNWEVDGQYVTYSTPFMGMYQVTKPDGLYKSQHRFGMYRWHIMDPIRFEDDLRITVQDLGWGKSNPRKYLIRQDDIASVAFWYQTLPTMPFPPLPNNSALEIV